MMTEKEAWAKVKKARDMMKVTRSYQSAKAFEEAARQWLATQHFELVDKLCTCAVPSIPN